MNLRGMEQHDRSRYAFLHQPGFTLQGKTSPVEKLQAWMKNDIATTMETLFLLGVSGCQVSWVTSNLLDLRRTPT